MEITKMLTLSTSHISKETVKLLEHYDPTSLCLPTYYKKDNYGWFIFIPDDYLHKGKDGLITEMFPDIPDDLHNCCLKAKGACCNWLCLDCDGQVDDELPTYEW